MLINLLEHFPVERIRNIGIIAHIDAGKTTTTERMLFYSGLTRRIGEVDKGDTIMDYLPEERERGITITSACVTFGWKDHKINLIDTPGHVDFTIEVERAIRVLDGAVLIIDAVAGVEAQTETVWEQANNYNLPRIAFINKMDRNGASFDNSASQIITKLQSNPLVVQIPYFEADIFCGIVDLVEEQLVTWKDSQGLEMEKKKWNTSSTFTDKRKELMEKIAELDDLFLEKYLETPETITTTDLKKAIRRLCLKGTVIPVLCGASFRNIGVQPLVDAVLDYLPAPNERPYPIAHRPGKADSLIEFKESGKLVALAYKVVNDQKRGLLVFVRVYSGVLDCNFTLFNANRQNKERISKIYNVYADKFEAIDCIPAGNIGVVIGTKQTCTGDTLLLADDKDKVTLSGINIPPPVFYCSVEPNSLSDEKNLKEALQLIEMEDPSFKVETNIETGQLLMSGMGELHLEIIRNKLLNEYKVNASVGKVQISNRETIEIEEELAFNHKYEKEISGKLCSVDMVIILSKPKENFQSKEVLISPKVVLKTYTTANTEYTIQEIEEQLRQGFESVLVYGPHNGCPVDQIKLKLTKLSCTPETSLVGIRNAASDALKTALKICKPVLLEPISLVTIRVNQKYFGVVMNDINSIRNGEVIEVEDVNRFSDFSTSSDLHHIITALIPLSQLIGYSTALRSITAGTASFSMKTHSYRKIYKEQNNKQQFI